MTAGNRWSDQSIVASCDRSYEHSWHPVTDRTRKSWHPVTKRTINSDTRRPMVRSIVGCNDRSHDQSLQRATDRTINRCYLRPIVRSIVAPYYVESQVRRFEHYHDLAGTVLPWRSPTTYGASCTFFLRFAHDANIFRSRLGIMQ